MNFEQNGSYDQKNVITQLLQRLYYLISILVDIPDVVGDISKIQPLLISQKDPAKMLIWMEVFKRSVIKARPIRPFVKVCEMLPVADCR